MPLDNTALEQALERAAGEPAARPEFYRQLLDAQVIVIGHSDPPAAGTAMLEAGARVSIFNWQTKDGLPFIPFFSSLAALQRVLDEEAGYLALPVRTLFEMTRGATLVLNPGSDHGKEFFPAEVEALLTSGVNHVGTQRVVQEATEVLLGQPANRPEAMVSALAALFAKHAGVRAAYLCLMHDPAASPAPVLMIGVEGVDEADLDPVIREAGAVAADTAPAGEPVDFVQVRRGDGGISDYFAGSVPPFYKRGLGSKLRSLFG